MNRFGKKILAVSLMLTSVGCSEKTENAEEQTISVEKAARVNNGDLQGDSIAVAVGKQGVTYDEYLVYNWFLKNQYDSMLARMSGIFRSMIIRSDRLRSRISCVLSFRSK